MTFGFCSLIQASIQLISVGSISGAQNLVMYTVKELLDQRFTQRVTFHFEEKKSIIVVVKPKPKLLGLSTKNESGGFVRHFNVLQCENVDSLTTGLDWTCSTSK